MTASSGRSSRPGYANFAIGLLMLAILVPIAVHSQQPPPPEIAEYAPQAQQIKEPPKEQSALVGKAGGEGKQGQGPAPGGKTGGATGGPLATAQPTPAPINVTRERRCIGDPPRQIDDPQSPPCVAYWTGNDNGGSTWKGVDQSTIKVAWASTASSGSYQLANALVRFFNAHMQFYNRKIVLIPYIPGNGCTNCSWTTGSSSGNASWTPAQMGTDAATVNSLGVFADLGYQEDNNGEGYYFYDALARDQVLSVEMNYGDWPQVNEGHLSQLAPYEWNYVPSVDRVEANVGEMYCRSLAGKAPTYAGPPQSVQATRVLGVVKTTHSDGTAAADITPLTNALAACGVNPVVEPMGDATTAQDAENAILAFKGAKVTDVMCFCQTGWFGVELMGAASKQGYYPEWIATNFGHQDDDYAALIDDSSESSHIIGMKSWNKSLPAQDEPWYWAASEIDPNTIGGTNVDNFTVTYWNLLLLASGIQMAGPHLTPQTFQDGLFRAEFPNPHADGPPYYQARVDFPGVHTMIQSFAPVWYNPSAPSFEVNGETGAYCYVDVGRRYRQGSWPANLTFKSNPCR